jgi:hypothetical protein
LLSGTGQLPVGLRLRAHSLNRSHNVPLLRQKGVSQIRSPRDVVIQEFKRGWERDQRLNAGIPVLLLGGIY